MCCEPGAGVLVPAPYYAAFENDMKVMAGLVPVPTYCADPRSGPTEADLEAAYTSASRDRPVSMLLLTNPHNPLGVVYSAKTLLSCVTWARTKGIHVVVDEIYAMSVHQSDGNGSAFRSVLDVLGGELGDDVHVVWAMSKDFGSSGLRAGILLR